VGLVFGINVGEVVDPAVVLLDLVLRASVKPQRVLGGQGPERRKLLIEVGDVVFLQDNQVFPVVLLTEAHGRPTREKPVQAQAEGQARARLLQPPR